MIEIVFVFRLAHVVWNVVADRIAQCIDTRCGLIGDARFCESVFIIICRAERRLRQGIVRRAVGHGVVSEFKYAVGMFRVHARREHFGRLDHGIKIAFAIIYRAESLVYRQKQLVGGLLVGHFLPVDHAIDEIDRLVIARVGEQNTAIEDVRAPFVGEFRFESDRCLIGDDLHVMIGNAAQHRSTGHGRQTGKRAVLTGLDRQFGADERNLRIVDIVRQVEQNRIGPEVVERVGFEVGNVWEVEIAEKRRPVIVGANLHAAFVLADRRWRRIEIGVVLLDVVVVEVLLSITEAEKAAQPVHHCISPRRVLPNRRRYEAGAVKIGLKKLTMRLRQKRRQSM